MKQIKLTNSIKRVLLAFALTSLSFSSASALDIIVHDDEGFDGDNIITANGTIQFKGGNSSVDLYNNSQLGNAAGGRFSVTSVDPSPQYNHISLSYNSSLYVTGISATNLNISMYIDSYLYSDGAIILKDSMMDMQESTLIAPYLEVEAMGLGLSYLEAAVKIMSFSAKGAHWVSLGSSTIDADLSIRSTTVELRMSSATDTITATEIYLVDANNVFSFSFTDEFIESIFSGAGYYDLVFADTIIGTFTGTGAYDIYVADSNDSYCWTVTDLGGEVFRIEFIQIPEPSTYAAIFGLIALAFVAYKRRK